ncbi:MAG: biotin transporter BioY [Hyphomicrobiaceae bacterium]|nr:biotin transporter BioY [Hyphomicrobiaceae bacterium]
MTSAPLIVSRIWPENRASRALRFIALAVLGTLLLTLSAKIKVPFYPVPMTMQTFVVLGLAAAYGWRLGLATVGLYLLEGALGLPVFTGTPERGIGLVYMTGPTLGYLVGFCVAAVMVGLAAERGLDRRPFALLAVMLGAVATILGLGWAWLATLIGPETAFTAGVVPFVLGDVTKAALAAAAVPAVQGLLGRRG